MPKTEIKLQLKDKTQSTFTIMAITIRSLRANKREDLVTEFRDKAMECDLIQLLELCREYFVVEE